MTTQSSAPASTSSAAPRTYKILVAVAFDPTDHAAMTEGMKLAARSPGSELHVVHAITQQPLDEGPNPLSITPAATDRAVEWLRARVEAAWEQSGQIQVIAHVRPGNPAEAILQAAIDIDADVVIVGSHRRTGLRKLVLGSVAERVLHEAHCPVLVAIDKNYSGTTASPQIEPPCPDCLDVRKRSGNAKFWCERHDRPHLQTHIYVPRDGARSSLMPTY